MKTARICDAWHGLIWLLTLLLLAVPTLRAAETPPEIPREFRAAWVATVFNLNWPSRPGLPEGQQKAELRAIFDRAVALHLNAIIFQVRPSCDALYASKLEPWSAFLTGKMGQSPGYDPLEFAINEAHARGLELHAWFNPFRALTSTKAAASENHVTRTHSEWTRTYGNLVLLDPGEAQVRDYVRSVILDVVRRYDVDGVHIDDYFYPYPVKDKAGAILPFTDSGVWGRYLSGGGKLALGDWRRDNINQFVESTYRAIKAEKRWVKFGISPFGIWRPRVPETIEAKLDAYEQLYADSRRWLTEGWCDYFSPQLYWPIDPAAQSFPVLYHWWAEQNRAGRRLWPGIATDRIGAQRPAQEIIRQIGITREPGKTGDADACGQVLWDMKSLMHDAGGIDELLRSGPYKDSALVPALPWLGTGAPAAPQVAREGRGVSWKMEASADPVRWWAVQSEMPSGWQLKILPAGVEKFVPEAGCRAVAVRAIDRCGAAGLRSVVELTTEEQKN